MLLTKEQIEQIIEIIDLNTEYEVEVQGYHDYEVIPTRTKKDLIKIEEALETI